MMIQISLIAAFVAGMVALFAPCCVTYLLPAYLGNVFREKKKVLLMTLIYSLGIMVVMLPVVLGVKALSSLFFRMHDWTYIVGGMVMIGVAWMSLFGIKLPMPKFSHRGSGQRVDAWSTFILGVFSGITSSCCAPVLVGVLTLSSMAPGVIWSLLVGVVYVLGMVTPLYIASLFIDKKNLLASPLWRKRLGVIRLGSKEYLVLITDLVAFMVFLTTGVLMIWLTLNGNLGMDMAESETTRLIYAIAFGITERVQGFWLDGLFVAGVVYVVYKLVNVAVRKR